MMSPSRLRASFLLIASALVDCSKATTPDEKSMTLPTNEARPLGTTPSFATASATPLPSSSATPSGSGASSSRALPKGAPCPVAPPGVPNPNGKGSCKSDADCAKDKNGRCKPVYMGHGMMQNACTSDECMVDADCKGGKLCLCGATYTGRNACLPGDCKEDADCPGGEKCQRLGPSYEYSYSSSGSFCHSAKDECKSNDDCAKAGAGSLGATFNCDYDSSKRKFVCKPPYAPPPG